jgi:UDP-N-acetyl-D-glucosamine dehydrogenase
MRKYKIDNASIPLTAENLEKYDCVVVATDHSAYDPEFIVHNAQLVVDTRNLIKNYRQYPHKVKKA